MGKTLPYHSLIEDEPQYIPADVKLSVGRLESPQMNTRLASPLSNPARCIFFFLLRVSRCPICSGCWGEVSGHRPQRGIGLT